MASPRWRCTASQDNDVRHEDHRYQRGLASRTKDIRLMIPYVTRGVFTRRYPAAAAAAAAPPSSPLHPHPVSPLRWQSVRRCVSPPQPPNGPQNTPLATVNIFSFDQAGRGRGCSRNSHWSNAAITIHPEPRLPATSWGLFAGSLLLFFHPPTIHPQTHPPATEAAAAAAAALKACVIPCSSSSHCSRPFTYLPPINKLSSPVYKRIRLISSL